MTQNDTSSFMKQTEPVNYKMETAQSMMDTKNLGIIQDQMYHEALAYKKSRKYSASSPSRTWQTVLPSTTSSTLTRCKTTWTATSNCKRSDI